MKLKITSFLFFSILFFTSFASENKSEILTKREVSISIIAQKENVIEVEKQKLNFKEKLASKLFKRKIKNIQSKKVKNNIQRNGKKIDKTLLVIIEISLLSLVLTSIILSIVSFFSGNILVGILLILIGALLAILFLGFAMIDNEGQRVMLENFNLLF